MILYRMFCMLRYVHVLFVGLLHLCTMHIQARIQVNECANGISAGKICASCVYTRSHGVFSLRPNGSNVPTRRIAWHGKCYYERVLQGLRAHTYMLGHKRVDNNLPFVFPPTFIHQHAPLLFVWHTQVKTLLLGLLWTLSSFEGVAEHTLKTRLAQQVAGVAWVWLHCRQRYGLKVR